MSRLSRRAGQPARSTEVTNGIEARGIGKTLRGREILRDVNMEVPRGTVAVIEGDNGAGKTTLVRILGTVVSPDTGAALVNGYDVTTQALAVRRSIGISFANERSLYWRISGYENLELFGRIAGLSKRLIARRSADICDRLHIGEVARGRVSQMSTGQRQRLMVARSLLSDPAVLILDEPFRGLDEDGLQALIGLVAHRAQGGTTVLIVAPLIAAVLPVAGATYRMDAGTVRPVTANELSDHSGDRP